MTQAMTVEDLEARLVAANGPTIKVNLAHLDGGNEGLWAKLLTKKDQEVYEMNDSGSKLQVVLCNHALVPAPTWGLLFTATTNGKDRPSITIRDFLDQLVMQDNPHAPS